VNDDETTANIQESYVSVKIREESEERVIIILL
jgi:hypothetical protein